MSYWKNMAISFTEIKTIESTKEYFPMTLRSWIFAIFGQKQLHFWGV